METKARCFNLGTILGNCCEIGRKAMLFYLRDLCRVMVTRLFAVLLTVLLVSTVPLGTAIDRSWTVDTAATSGNYLDLATRFVYAYDATLGTLAPTGTLGDVSVYVNITASDCGTDCALFLVNVHITGNHCVKWVVKAVDSSGFEWPDDTVGDPPFCGTYGAPLVTAVVGRSQHVWNNHNGIANATLYVDGIPRGSASDAY